MDSQPVINPDVVCQQAIQAKLAVYQAKEHFESVLKTYNDQLDTLVYTVALMKARIMELEAAHAPSPPAIDEPEAIAVEYRD